MMTSKKEQYEKHSNKNKLLSEATLFMHDLYKLLDSEFPNRNISLVSGNSGVMIFFIKYYHLFRNDAVRCKIDLMIDFNLDIISEQKMQRLDFGTGIIGTIWSLYYSEKEDLIELPQDFVSSEQEDDLNKYFLKQAELKNFDLFYGGIGLSLMYLEKNKTRAFYIDFITKIKSQAILAKTGIFWEDKLIQIDDPVQKINLGLAHGIPSIIYIMSKFWQQDIDRTTTREIVYSAIEFLKNNKNKFPENESIFPNLILGSKPEYKGRLAWCYGDLGIAMAFWIAGKTFEDETLMTEAKEIMLHAAKRRDLHKNGVVDAGFCHGTAGIAHIFNRLYKETNLKELDEARWYWFDQTIRMGKNENGLLGYKAWQGDKGWQNEFGLLEGVAGIGLALIGFMSDELEDLNWDRCFLLN